jgi:lipopolysaccharide biosynthesis glycosyltransferase/tetratricopeptide (TPR) repeat protein
MNAVQSPADTTDVALDYFLKERYEASNELLLNMVHSGTNTSFISFCIGRNFRYLNDRANASEWFTRSLAFPEPFRWAYYEFAMLREIEEKIPEATTLAADFALSFSGDRASADLNDLHKASLLGIAHTCFRSDRSASVPLYRALDAIGVKDYLSALRIIENDIDQKRIEIANDQMNRLMADYKLDPWGQFVLSRIQFAQGNRDAAIATVISAAERKSSNHIVQTTAVHRLLEYKALPEARVQYERTLVPLIGQSADVNREIAGINFRLNVLLRDHDSLLAACRTPGLLAGLPNWVMVEALFTFALSGEHIDQADVALATELANFLESQRPHSVGTILSLYQFHSRRRNWEKIAELEQNIADHPKRNSQEIVLRRFESMCERSMMEEARACYQTHYANATLSQTEARSVLRFLCECGMWDEAGTVLKQFIASRYFFPDGDYFLMKICRRANIHQQILRIIDKSQTADVPAQFGRLQRLLRDDLVLRGAEGSKSSKARTSKVVISAENRVLYKATLPKPSTLRIAGFLCADKAYFMSLLTFLASYVSNCYGNTGIKWFIFLAKDVPPGFVAILEDFAYKVGLSLEIVREKNFVGAGPGSVESYGIFTGGNTLSRAAFLRIYAAKYLFQTGLFHRACYIDSDIICQKDITTFVSQPFGDALLLARAEDARPEVRSVAERHGIPHTSYFNSGVLQFNFRNPGVMTHIDHALHISESEPQRLVFHDQCALNIAFAGKVRYLEPCFNYFLRPHRIDNGDFAEAVFIHFLDRPKPWDISYTREYRTAWTRAAEWVRVMLSAKNYRQIVLAANR